MNFAIVGETDETLLIVEALERSGAHRVTHAAGVGDESQVLARFPGVRRVADWEDLLTEEDVDAAIVSGSEDAVLAPARQIASSGRPLLVVPSAGMTSAFAYELSLVRDENLVPLFPVVPHRLNPAAIAMQRLVAEKAAGEPIQIRMERTIVAESHLLDAARDVEVMLRPDADLLRWIGGSFTQVTALYQGSTESGFANATVNLAGDSAIDSTWQLSAGDQPAWKVTAVCADGRIVLEHSGGTTRLMRDGESLEVAAGQSSCSDDEWLTALPDAVDELQSADQARLAAAWVDFTRSHEIVDAHRRSVRRRRTIDLHFETLSERSQFKTQMAAMGCGVLTYTLFGLVAYLVVAGMFAPADDAPETQWSRYRLLCRIGFAVWILPLVVFLASQLLLVITKPAAKPTSEQA